MSLNLRIISDICIFLAILFLPWWIYSILILGAVIVLPFYWEALVFVFFIEALYGYTGVDFPSLIPIITLSLLVILVPVREELRF